MRNETKSHRLIERACDRETRPNLPIECENSSTEIEAAGGESVELGAVRGERKTREGGGRLGDAPLREIRAGLRECDGAECEESGGGHGRRGSAVTFLLFAECDSEGGPFEERNLGFAEVLLVML